VLPPVDPEAAPKTAYLLGGPLDGSKVAVRQDITRVEVDLSLEQGGGAAVYDSIDRTMPDGSWLFVYRRRRPTPHRLL
jgi:hypothetical protein